VANGRVFRNPAAAIYAGQQVRRLVGAHVPPGPPPDIATPLDVGVGPGSAYHRALSMPRTHRRPTNPQPWIWQQVVNTADVSDTPIDTPLDVGVGPGSAYHRSVARAWTHRRPPSSQPWLQRRPDIDVSEPAIDTPLDIGVGPGSAYHRVLSRAYTHRRPPSSQPWVWPQTVRRIDQSAPPVPVTVTPRVTDATLLDLDGISVRTDRFRFDLLNAANVKQGEIHPVTFVKIDNSTGQAIKRRMSGFKLDPTEAADIDVLTDRVQPVMILENGSEYPLGVFLFADAATTRHSYGNDITATLIDQGLVIGQQLRTTVGVASGTNIGTAIATVAAQAGITSVYVDSTAASLGAPLVWPAGKSSATYGKVLADLAALGGFHDPYFSNTGVLTFRALTNPDSITADLTYADGGRIIAESMTEWNDLLSAPNLYVVVDTASTGNPVTYEYELSADAPHSIARRGFAIPRYVEAPGIGNVDNALALAQTQALSDVLAWETIHFASPLDPRHDTFDVVAYRGVNYLELGWSMTLAPGGPMEHELKRVLL
jgi:hypothetical protein